MQADRQKIYWAALALLVTACTTGPHQPAPVDDRTAEEPGSPAVTVPTTAVPPSHTGAVAALLRQAEGHYERGESEQAIAAAERALRIDRRESSLYLILAHSYLHLEQPGQAEAFARQGLRYSRDPSVTDALQEAMARALAASSP